MHFKSYENIVVLLSALSSYHALFLPHLRPRGFGFIGGAGHDLGATRTASGLGKDVHGFPSFHPTTPITTVSKPKNPLPSISHTNPSKELPELPKNNVHHPPAEVKPTFDKSLVDYFKETYPDGRRKQSALKEMFRISTTKKVKVRNARDSWTVHLNQLKLKNKEGYTSIRKWLQKMETPTKPLSTKITTSAKLANDRWSEILDKIKTQVGVGTTKLRNRYTQTKAWLLSLKTKPLQIHPGTPFHEVKSPLPEGAAEGTEFDILSSFVLPDPRPPLDALLKTIGKDLVGNTVRKFDKYEPVTVDTVLTHLLPATASPTEKQQMKELLTLVQRQQINLDRGKQILRDWEQDLQWIRPVPTAIEAQTKLEVQKLLNEFDTTEFFKSFDKEYQAAIDSIKTSKIKFGFDLDQHFKDLYNKFKGPQSNAEAELFLQQFASARAIQMNKLPRSKLDQTSFLEPQDLVQNLPKGLDLKTELFHYIMIKGFDKIIDQIPLKATDEFREAFTKIINIEQIKSWKPEYLKSLFASTAKEDVEWRESIFAQLNRKRLSPSEVFQELKGQTSPASRITYALDNKANSLSFLPDKDLQALRSAFSNRGNFRKQLALTETAMRERNDQLKAAELKKLEQIRTMPNSPERTKAIDALQTETSISPDDLKALRNAASSDDKTFGEKLAGVEASVKTRQDQILQEQLTKIKQVREEALSINPTNHAYADELFKDGLIDEATRAKLNPAKKISQAEFISALGTEEQFTKLLMNQFQSFLIKEIGSSRVVQDDILTKTIAGMTSQYLTQLQSKAQAIYLKPDAFLKTNSFNFDEALKVFDPKELEASPDLLTKAYVEAKLKLDSVPLQPENRYSRYSAFFDAIKLERSQLKSGQEIKDEILEYLPGFDERIFQLYQRPLTAGDPRLRGTPFENLTPEGRERLNEMAKRLYTRSNTRAEGQEDGLSMTERENEIKKIVASFSPEEQDELRDRLHELPIFETQVEDAPKHQINKPPGTQTQSK